MSLLKSYTTYTSSIYKLFIHIIYPLLAIAIIIGIYAINYNSLVCIAVYSTICVGFEILSDYFMFNGVLSNSYNTFEYIKLSKKGKEYYKKVIVATEIRRLVYYVLFFVLAIVIGHFFNANNLKDLNYGILAMVTSYLITMIAIFLTRLSLSFYVTLFILYVATFLNTIISTLHTRLINNFNINPLIISVINIILSAILTVTIIKKVCKKMEGSFYD